MQTQLDPRVYEILTIGVVQDLPFYIEVSQQYNGPILDLGAGLGRISIPLLEAGHPVVLVDNNTHMCTEVARRLSHLSEETLQRVWVIDSDITQGTSLDIDDLLLGSTDTLPKHFSLIILGLRTMHLFNEDERRQIFSLAKNQLKQGGALLLHYSDIANTPEQRYWSLVTEHPLEFGTIEVEECFFFHQPSQRYHLRHRLWQSNVDGQHIGSWRVAHNLYAIEKNTLIRELNEYGFTNINTHSLYGTESVIIAKL